MSFSSTPRSAEKQTASLSEEWANKEATHAQAHDHHSQKPKTPSYLRADLLIACGGAAWKEHLDNLNLTTVPTKQY
jgi:hypothetical protein